MCPCALARGFAERRVALSVGSMLARERLRVLLVAAGACLGRLGALARSGGHVLVNLEFGCGLLVVGGGVLVMGACENLSDLREQTLDRKRSCSSAIARERIGPVLCRRFHHICDSSSSPHHDNASSRGYTGEGATASERIVGESATSAPTGGLMLWRRADPGGPCSRGLTTTLEARLFVRSADPIGSSFR